MSYLIRAVLLTIGAGLAWSASAFAVEARSLRFEMQDFHVVGIDLKHDDLQLRWKDRDGHPIASIERLREGASSAGGVLRFATNAGIYDRQFRPLGLHIEAGKTLRALNSVQGKAGSGNFSIPPNGVFWVGRDGAAGVVTTSDWRAAPRDARLASQSGPMLVIDGQLNPQFDEGSESLKWRSGVCVPSAGRVEFAVSVAPVSFHAFARLFRDQLGCRDALYLDGTLSRIWTADSGYFGAPAFMVRPYVGIFAVFSGPIRSN